MYPVPETIDELLAQERLSTPKQAQRKANTEVKKDVQD
jgi:hypothetical protein